MSYPESKWDPLKQKTGSHLEKNLENVSGGHFERKKKNKTPPPSFFPQRPDAKHVFFLLRLCPFRNTLYSNFMQCLYYDVHMYPIVVCVIRPTNNTC